MSSMQKLCTLQGKVGGLATESRVNLKKQRAAIYQGVRIGGSSNHSLGVTALLY